MRRVAAAAVVGLALIGAGPAAAIEALDLKPRGATVERTLWLVEDRDDWVNDLVPLPDGGFLAVGFLGRDDAVEGEDWTGFVQRFDRDEREVWRRDHGQGSGTDALWTVARRRGGGFVGVGFTDRIGAGGLDGWIVRLGPDGELVGEATVGGPGYDRLTDLAPAQGGGFVAVGFTTGDGRDVLVVGLDDDGRERWRRVYGGPGAQSALYVEPAGDGGFIVNGGDDAAGDGDVLVLKLDADGREVWRKLIGERGGLDVPHNLHVLPDGRIRMSGYTASWGARGPHDMFALTLDPDGETQRLELFGGDGDERVIGAALDAQGRSWVTGYTRTSTGGDWDAFLVRLDADGGFEGWIALLGHPGLDDNGTTVRPDADGSAWVGLYTTSLADPEHPSGQDIVIARITPTLDAHPAFARRRIR